MEWFVYVLLSEGTGATYVGITVDVERRLAQHNGLLSGGARRTRMGRPWRVAARCGPFADRGTALRLEHELKGHRGRARIEAALTLAVRSQ